MTTDEIDWESILNLDNNDAENFDFFNATSSPPENQKEEEVASWVGELECLLMNDDVTNNNGDYFKEFDVELGDLLLDSPEETERERERESPPSSEAEVVNVEVEENNSSPSLENVNCENYKSSDDQVEVNDDNDNDDDDNDNDNDDPLSKKRKRQLRNRDAAMRSRERKKLFVKDLEMKSRYFEEECRRLQRMLHCCYAENQWLRCSLQTYGAPLTKPESAVLLPEPLLLGSLVWLIINICLLPQSKLPLLNQDAAILVNGVRKLLETNVPRGKGTKKSELWISRSFTRTKRCRASRTKMKSHSTIPSFLYDPTPQPRLTPCQFYGILSLAVLSTSLHREAFSGVRASYHHLASVLFY